jgi:hypothetical protein
MNAPGSDERYSPAWAILFALVSLLIVLFAPAGRRFSAAGFSAFVFAAVQTFVPSVRPRRDVILSPINFAVFLYFFQLVVLPTSLIIAGVGQATLPFLPADHAINIAILLVSTGHLAFTTGYVYQHSKAHTQQPPAVWHPPRALQRTFIGLGCLGLFLTFHSVNGLLLYFRSAADAVLLFADTSSSLSGYLGGLLRPFLQFAAVLAWCRWADERGRTAPLIERIVTTAAAAVAVIVVGSTFFYSRSAMVYPLIPLIGVYSWRVRRISVPAMVAGGAAFLVPLILFGVYRSSGLELGQIGADVAGALLRSINILGYIQLYAQGPQFLAFLLEQAHFGDVLYLGTTLIASIMHPVPVLGAAFRGMSGVTVYNQMIYGPYEVPDQVIPFVGELFLNWHVGGVIVGFLGVGAIVSGFQRRYEAAPTAADAFLLLYASIWFLFLLQGSLAVISQVALYSMWPAYAYYFWRRRALRNDTAAGRSRLRHPARVI